MSYLALARKWRPNTFSQLVGQEHINKAVINSLDQQRLHHAYLFTGTRGVGKTSIARLLAKAMNCEVGISSEPCLKCSACLAIEQGRFIDLIEIDGASRTRVEDTRELLENVQYRPTYGRFKVYLIDEVHMLSQHSFNALLKTLEEPPAHVKFLLATTDPQKLPLTVLSRCLQFSLRHLAPEIINQHLQYILGEEQQTFDVEAIELLAKAAKGSMRDALSLLDQAIATVSDKLTVKEVKEILGYTQQDYAIQLLQALAELDAQLLIQLSRQIASESEHFHYVLDELLNYLHQITVAQSLSSDNPLIISRPEIRALAQQFSPEDTQLFYQIAIKGTQEIQLAPTNAIGFEMTLLRMLTFKPAPKVKTPKLSYALDAIPSAEKNSPLTDNKQNNSFIVKESDSKKDLSKQEQQIPSIAPKIAVELPQVEDWVTVVTRLKLTGLTLNAAENTEFIAKSGREILLRVAKGHQSLFTPSIIARLEQALNSYYKETIKIALSSDEPVQSSPAQQKQIALNVRQQDVEEKLQNDSFFQQLKQEFSAEVVKNSLAPVKDEV
ncbi:MAG: DNA polymerase III subunit gamma/tau [Tatlockia sp.]|nr:DNA polymerase III subunit gamma/tau [Tatlockia sp.]